MSLMLGKHSIGRCFKGQWHWYNRAASIRPSLTTRRYDACTNRAFVRTRASGDDEPTAIGMTTEDAYKILGVTGAATFDDILGAKNKMLAAVDGDQEKTMEVEAAYDIIFMQSMKRRLAGEMPVSSTVRFADVPTKKKAPQGKGSSVVRGPAGLAFQKPRKEVATQQSVVFGALALWALIQASTEPEAAQIADVAGLQLALATGFSIYSLKDTKKMELGRAIGLAVALFFAGSLFGGLLENWVRVDIVPIGSFGSPGVFVAEWAILATWLGTLFIV